MLADKQHGNSSRSPSHGRRDRWRGRCRLGGADVGWAEPDGCERRRPRIGNETVKVGCGFVGNPEFSSANELRIGQIGASHMMSMHWNRDKLL